MPRSGTTLLFATFAAHPRLGWFSQYQDRFPSLPGVAALRRAADLAPGARKGVRRHTDARRLAQTLQIAPTEAWAIWERCCGEKFSFEYLRETTATPEERECLRRRVRRTLRLQGKKRFATKITGPARIGYLSSVFGDATFVHVIRDGRAVAESLMRVPFWKDTFRLNFPAWRGGLAAPDIAAWRERGSSPLELAALQWREVTSGARDEARELAPGHYHEVRFEDFIRRPHETIDDILGASDLEIAPEVHHYVDTRVEIKNLSDAWRERIAPAETETLESLCGGLLEELGYDTGARAAAAASAAPAT
jgi:hypothetical protein